MQERNDLAPYERCQQKQRRAKLHLVVFIAIVGIMLTMGSIIHNILGANAAPLTILAAQQIIPAAMPSGPLRVSTVNSRYFADSSGKIVYLTGSHTWSDFMDSGVADPPPALDYVEFLDFLAAHNHNFFRLWRAENARGGETGWNYWFSPLPYARTGPGTALDGKPQFDLNQFNQAYFDRMRERIMAAGERGIYVSIMLFDGWSIESKFGGHDPWRGHPYNRSNNSNGVDGDSNNNSQGEETHTLQNGAITALQEAYVRKVVDTVNDLDNVLYEISNESPGNSQDWQYHMINLIKGYEATKPKQHPVGMTVEYPGGLTLTFLPAQPTGSHPTAMPTTRLQPLGAR